MHFNIDKHDFKRILVIRFSSLGDIVLTTPVLTALRNKYKDAQIDYLLKEQYADLIRHHPACVNVILLREEVRADSEKFLEFIESLKKNNYNLVIDLQGNAR